MHLSASALTEAAAEFRRRQEGGVREVVHTKEVERVELDGAVAAALNAQADVIAQLAARIVALETESADQRHTIKALEESIADVRATYAPLKHIHSIGDLERASA